MTLARTRKRQATPNAPPDDFTESTPRPRLVGDPLPAYTRIVTGDDPVRYYRDAVAAHRVPQGSELLRFRGGSLPAKAYEVAATSGQPGFPAWAFGPAGTRIDPPAGWVMIAVIAPAAASECHTVWVKAGVA